MAKNKFGFEKNDLMVFRRVLAKMPKLTGGKWKIDGEALRFETKMKDMYKDTIQFCPISSFERADVGEYDSVGRRLGFGVGVIAAIAAAADYQTGSEVNNEAEAEPQDLAIREALLLAAFNKLPKGSMPKGYKPQLATR